jgi:hypothetical protein
MLQNVGSFFAFSKHFYYQMYQIIRYGCSAQVGQNRVTPQLV